MAVPEEITRAVPPPRTSCQHRWQHRDPAGWRPGLRVRRGKPGRGKYTHALARRARPPTWPRARPAVTTVNEAYLEVNVPVLADLPGAKELTFNGATRSRTTPSATRSATEVRLQVEADRLADGAWHLSRGFRAPTISDLFGGGSETSRSSAIRATPASVPRPPARKSVHVAHATSPMRIPSASCARVAPGERRRRTRPRCRSPPGRTRC